MADALHLTIKPVHLGWWEVKDSAGILRNYGATPEEALHGFVRSWRAAWPRDERLPCPEHHPDGAVPSCITSVGSAGEPQHTKGTDE